MKKICIIFGHHNTKDSFNAAIRDTFIDEAEKCGHQIDLINLFEEKEQLPFYNSNVNPPPNIVLEYRKRLENADIMFLIGSCHNLRLNAILENWIDWVLHPKWFFTYRSIIPESKFFKNYGFPVPGAMKGKLAIVSMSYGGNWFSIQTWFQNIPFRRIKAGVLKLGGMKTIYDRHYEVLPGMSKEKFAKHMKSVRRLVKKI